MVCRTHKSEGLFALTGKRNTVARRLMDAEVRYKDQYPLVRPRSSLLTYLELCKPGAEIDFWWLSGNEEEAVLARKLDDHTWWVGDPGEDVMSYTLVGMLRTYVEENVHSRFSGLSSRCASTSRVDRASSRLHWRAAA